MNAFAAVGCALILYVIGVGLLLFFLRGKNGRRR